MITVAGYCRVSTDKEDQANSFAAQQRYFQAYIAANPDWKLYAIYADEGLSGTGTKKRAQFQRMIQDAYDGRFQLILTKEVSRFSRNIVDTLSYTRELKRIGVSVEFMTDRISTMDSDGELRLSIMAAMAQEESRKTSSRVVWGQTRQMERGVVFGRSLLGYEVSGGKLTIESEGAKTVGLIFQKYAVEQMSTTQIARFLMQAGYRTYRGGRQWSSNAVVKILKNEKYAGDLVQKKTYTPDYLTHAKRTNRGEVPLIRAENHHAPIVSRELWELAQRRLVQNNKHSDGAGGHSNRYVFSGKIKCGQCGAGFVGRVRRLKDGTQTRRWSCGTVVRHGNAGCAVGKLVRDDDALAMLKTSIRHLELDTAGIVRSVTELALEAVQSGERGRKDDPEQLQYELTHIRQKKETAMDSFFSGDISRQDMLTMKLRYEQQEQELLNRLERAETRREQGRDRAHLQQNIHREVTALLCCDTESQIFYKTILESLTVFQDKHMELRLNHLQHIFYFNTK